MSRSPVLPLRLLIALLIPFLCSVQDADPNLVVETYPDGTVQRRYRVDDSGQKHGSFEQFFDDGTLEIRTNYSADALDGKYESFYESGAKRVVAGYSRGLKNGLWRESAESGDLLLVATYKKDVLHGKYEKHDGAGTRLIATRYKGGALHGDHVEFIPELDRTRKCKYKNGQLDGAATVKQGKKTVSRQKWKAGSLVDLDGLKPFERNAEELTKNLATILADLNGAPALDEGTDDDPQAGGRFAALRRLMAYRYLCRVNYSDLELVPRWNELCDAASEVCRMNGGLSHEPDAPPGMDDKRYSEGKQGARNSNLSQSGMVGQIDAYMDDSDSSNIDRVGHRRWCLNPQLKRTGFGADGRYSAMWALDRSGKAAKGLDAVLYPPAGWVPVDFFGSDYAWSISVIKGAVPNADDVEVRIRELDEHWVPAGEPLELNWKSVQKTDVGSGPCIIFRPVGLRANAGARYLAEISTDKGKSFAYRYVVAFCGAVGEAAN